MLSILAQPTRKQTSHISKLQCQKISHKHQQISFVCTEQNCQVLTRAGCIQCFPEHDGHTHKFMQIEDFFSQVHSKEQELNKIYHSLFIGGANKICRETTLKEVQTYFKKLNMKLQTFIDSQVVYLEQLIMIKTKQLEINRYLNIKNYHEELQKISFKPLLEQQDLGFLFEFLVGTNYQQLLLQCQEQKNKNADELLELISEQIQKFESTFDQTIQELDLFIHEKSGWLPINESKQSNNTNITSNQGIQLDKTKKVNSSNKQGVNRSKSTAKKSENYNYTPSKDQFTLSSRKTPSIEKYPAIQRFLITTNELGNIKNIEGQKDLEQFIIYIQLNYLKEEYLNENIKFLLIKYPEIFLVYEKQLPFIQKDKISLVQQYKTNLLKILWDNWMIEWFNQATKIFFKQKGKIQVKLHDFEDNYHSFLKCMNLQLGLFDKNLKDLKQKKIQSFFKEEHKIWLLLAQGNQKNQLSNQQHQNIQTIIRVYEIKSAVKKDYRNFDIFEERKNITSETSVQTLPKILQDHFKGEFKINEDSKILVKGFNDPRFQTFLLTERLQVFIDLAVLAVLNSHQQLNLLTLENTLDQLLINFQMFVKTIYEVCKDKI